MNSDPTKYPEWYKRFLRGVARVESAGGQLMMNPISTATGLYGQLYSEVDELPMLEGVSREEFAADTALQNRIMEQRFEGKIPGVPGLMRNVTELTAEYKPQLGEKFTFRPDEVAALTNFLGRQRTREYFASIRDNKPFSVPGVNKTPEDYLKEYNVGFGEVVEQPQQNNVTPELQDALDIMKRDSGSKPYRTVDTDFKPIKNAFGGRVRKKKNYGQNGMLVQKDPTLVPDPPPEPPADEVLARLSLGITPPDQQFRLRGEAAPFRTIKEQKDVIAEQESEGDMLEVLRYLPVTGEAIDAAELAKVFATGEDIYGEKQDPAMFAGMTAAGYLIPNVLEKPLKSAWRAVKKFPAKMPKREFRKLPTENREAVLQNLTQAHEEVYGSQLGMTRLTPEGETYREVTPRNIRQLPSLMSGSKLENAVGKDGMIQVSQIENLINSKDISAVEREALEEVMGTEAFQSLREMGGGSKVDYNKFRNLTSGQLSVHNNMYVERSKEYADYGIDNLGLNQGKDADNLVRISPSPDIARADDVGLARTNLIKHNMTDLMNKEYGHFGEDVIGHYRTFERPDEKGVLYISEMQADPLQARGPAGQKTVGLDVSKSVDVDAQLETARIQLEAAEKHLAEVRAGAPYNPQKVYGAEGLPTGRGSLEDPRGILATNKAEALGVDDITVLRENRDAEPWMKLEEKQLISFMDEHKRYIQALEGGYRGGPNAKQAALIKNQDQFLISHILEQEAKGADKLRFPTGETTAKIQSYGDQTERVRRAREGVNQYEASVKAARENELVDKAIKEHPMFKGKSEDEVFEIWNTKLGSEDYNQQYARGFDEMGDSDFNMRRAFNEWASETRSLKGQREHYSRINASEQATQGIMKGYDRLPKALKKHGLDATKVTDDVGNTWWEVDIPARLGEGVGEIRAYNKGGEVPKKIRVLKKEGYPQKQAVAIALAMQQKGQL